MHVYGNSTGMIIWLFAEFVRMYTPEIKTQTPRITAFLKPETHFPKHRNNIFKFGTVSMFDFGGG